MPVYSQSYCTDLYISGCEFSHNIHSFVFGDHEFLNTPCPQDGYGDFTEDTLVVHRGMMYDVWVNSTYPCCQYFAIWVDYNNDGDFDDEGEFIWASANATDSAYQWKKTQVIIPFDAPLGASRLRIRGKFGSPAFTFGQACTEYTWGETHDYTLKVLPEPPCMSPYVTSITNITQHSAQIQIQSGTWVSTTLVEYGPQGFEPGTGEMMSLTSSVFLLSGLEDSTTYDFYLQDSCISGEWSGWSGPYSFTTEPVYQIQTTFVNGMIPSFYQSPLHTSLNSVSPCAGILYVDIPEGYWITSVDVGYQITSTGGVYMDEQASRLVVPAQGIGEPVYTMGEGGTSGVYDYSRTDLGYFYGLTGEVGFYLDVKRLWGGSGCNTDYVYVNPGTWTLEVTYEAIPPCAAPQFLAVNNVTDVAATITWSALTPFDYFEYRIGLSGVPVDSMDALITDTTFLLLSGLEPETSYDFYVMAFCDSVLQSVWSGPLTFTTKCGFLSEGTYTLGNAGADFADFNALTTYLSCGGISGPVVIEVLSGAGPFTERVVFGPIAGASATSTLSIQGNGNILQYSPNVFFEQATLVLDASAYIHFDSLTIKSLSSNHLGTAVHLMNHARQIVFDNCKMEISSTYTGFGAVVLGSNSDFNEIHPGLSASQVSIVNSEITGGFYGIHINGPESAPWSEGNSIAHNVIRDFRYAGVSVTGQHNSLIGYNDIYRLNLAVPAAFKGITAQGFMGGSIIANNQIHNPRGMATGVLAGNVCGLCFSDAYGTQDHPYDLINNVVYDFNIGNEQFGMHFTGSSSHFRVFHNSVVLADDNETGTGAVRGISVLSNAANATIQNNLIHINHSGQGVKHAVYYQHAASIETGHNVLSMQSVSGSNYTGFATQNFTTFEAWQDAGFDEGGSEANPMLIDENSFPVPQYAGVFGIGTDLTAFAPVDFFSMERPATPCPGAIEFEPDTCIAYIVPLVVPGDTFAVVSWEENGFTNVWMLEYGPAGFEPGSGMVITTEQTSATLGGLVAETAYEVYVMPDCGTESVWSESVVFTTHCTFLSAGTYSLGGPGADFPDFSSLMTFFDCGGIAGPVVIEVTPGSGPFNEQIILGVIPGSSDVNTITINGHGSTLEYLSLNNIERATLKLKGTSHISFNNMTIRALGNQTLTYGYAVQLMDNAQHVTFDSCVIQASVDNGILQFAGLVASNSPTSATGVGLAASFLTVTNCEIIGGYYGMVISGPASAPWSTGNYIANNTIRDFYLYGLFVRGQENSIFDRNDITRENRTNVSAFYGIYANGGMNGTMFSNHRIYDPRGQAPQAIIANAAYPIYLQGASGSADEPCFIINNKIYNINLNGPAYGIYISGESNHYRIYHNSVSLGITGSSSPIAGLLQTSLTTDARIMNNIFHIGQGSSLNNYGISIINGQAEIDIDYNVYSLGEVTGIGYIGFFNGQHTSLTSWQAAGFDSSGVAANPVFVSSQTDLTPQNPAIYQIGTDLTSVAPLDYFGVVRTTTPDPGAIEFEPVSCLAPANLTATAVTASSAVIQWNDLSLNPVHWEIEWGLSGFEPLGIAGDTSMVDSFLLSGLEALTHYDVYVRVYCGDNDYSTWVGPVVIGTTCGSYELPFMEDFSGMSASCWELPSGNVNWAIGSQYQPPSAGGPPNAYFSWTPTVNNYELSLVSPVLNAQSATNPVWLNYFMFLDNYVENTSINSMHVEYKKLTDSVWTLLETFTTSGIETVNNIEFIRENEVLEGMEGSVFQVRFRATGVNSFAINGWGLDDVQIFESPDCPGILGLSADSVGPAEILLSWQELGIATSWEIEVVPAGTPPTGMATHTATSNPWLLTGLDPATQYDVYLQSDCDLQGVSTWVGLLNIVTQCIPESVTAVSSQVCGEGSVILMAASGNSSANFNWYDLPVGGNKLGEGAAFETPVLNESTTYYVEAVTDGASYSTGKPDAESNAGGTAAGLSSYLEFYAHAGFTLNSVNIYPYGTGAGSVTVELRDENNTSLQIVTVNANGQQEAGGTPVYVPLNFSIDGGALYRLGVSSWTGGVSGLFSDQTNIHYPYTVPYVLDILGSDAGTGLYPFFYNWQITAWCVSERIAVDAVVHELPAPDLGGDVGFCEGDSASISAGGDFASYLWLLETVDGIDSLWTPQVSIADTGTLSVLVTDVHGCTGTDEITVDMFPLPEIYALASTLTVCEGESIVLWAEGNAETFIWNGNIEDSIPFTPVETSLYTLTGISASGCIATASLEVEVNPVPEIWIEATAFEVCAGDEVILIAFGADEYLWTGGVENSVPFILNGSNEFVVIGTTGICSDTASIFLTANPLPDVSLELGLIEPICLNYSIPFELTGGTPEGGEYIGEGITGGIFYPELAEPGTYDVVYTFTDSSGCTAEATDIMILEICGNSEEPFAGKFRIYPNPFDQYIEIVPAVALLSFEGVRITDIAGRVVAHIVPDQSSSGGVLRFATGDWPAGAYVIEVQTGGQWLRQLVMRVQ